MSESRGWEGDEDTPYGLWLGRLRSAIHSRRGRAALRDLEAALLALPRKRLIMGALTRDGEVCAVGAFVAHRRCARGEPREEVLAEMEGLPRDKTIYPNDGETEAGTLEAAEAQGMSFTLAWHIGARNDEYHGRCTPEDRYAKVLAWVREKLAEPMLARSEQ